MLRGVIFAQRCFWLCQRETADGKARVRWWEAGMEKRAAERSGNELITIAEQRDLSQIFYLDGGTYEAPAIVVVIQAINHAIDHRSQISTLLSQQDIEPPDLDGWAYNDAMH